MKTSRHTSALATALAATLVASSLGCTKETAIRPTELPKLNGASTDVIGTAQARGVSANVVALTVRDVLTPDDRVVQVKGEFDLVVESRSLPELVVERPVMSEIDDDVLLVRGGNVGATTYKLDDIESTRIRQADHLANGLWIGGVIFAVFAAVFVPLMVITLAH